MIASSAEIVCFPPGGDAGVHDQFQHAPGRQRLADHDRLFRQLRLFRFRQVVASQEEVPDLLFGQPAGARLPLIEHAQQQAADPLGRQIGMAGREALQVAPILGIVVVHEPRSRPPHIVRARIRCSRPLAVAGGGGQARPFPSFSQTASWSDLMRAAQHRRPRRVTVPAGAGKWGQFLFTRAVRVHGVQSSARQRPASSPRPGRS